MNDSKNLMIYMPSFNGGGAERNGVLLANEFARRGHSVSLVVDMNLGPNKDIVSKNVNILGLEKKSHVLNILELRKIFKNVCPDCVYAWTGLSPIKAFAASLTSRKRKKVILVYRSSYDPNSKIGGRLAYLLSFFLTRFTKSTIAVSTDVKNELVDRFYAKEKKIKVVFNPVDLKFIQKKASTDSFFVFPKKKYILAAGRFVEQKDFPSLVLAYSYIYKNVDHDLVIIGDGPLRSSLEVLIQKLKICHRVYLPGYVDNPFPVYKNADLFVLSSSFEGFGNVVLEALALGVPVVSTRCCGGPKEILEDGRYGMLVPVNDSEALGNAMLKTIANPPASSFLKSRVSEFSVDKVADRYLRLSL